jgi:hypothetical protein
MDFMDMTVAIGSNNRFHTPMLVASIRTAVVCLVSTSPAPFPAGRALQAARIISTGSLVAAAVIGDGYPRQERAQAMSVAQTVLFLGPAVGGLRPGASPRSVRGCGWPGSRRSQTLRGHPGRLADDRRRRSPLRIVAALSAVGTLPAGETNVARAAGEPKGVHKFLQFDTHGRGPNP